MQISVICGRQRTGKLGYIYTCWAVKEHSSVRGEATYCHGFLVWTTEVLTRQPSFPQLAYFRGILKRYESWQWN